MKRNCLCGVALALALASSAWGYGYLDLGLGSGVFQGSARGGGMGEIALLSEAGPLAVTLNPAQLAGLSERQVAFSYRFASLDEDWSFPVHDSFDAVLGYNTYSANSKIYQDFTGGLASGRIARAYDVCFAVALVPAYDYRYDFAEEIRDRNSSAQPPDLMIANAFVHGTGEIRSLSFGLARPIYGGLSLGMGLDHLFGEREIESGVLFSDVGRIPWSGGEPESSETFSATDLAGNRFVVGATFALNERFALGAAYRSGCELEGDLTLQSIGPVDTTIGSTVKIDCPASYSLGVSFRPRNELPTVIEGNVVLAKWSEADLEDVYEWHIGVEHVFYNHRALRFGFLYRPSPSEKETSESAVTAGTGLRIGGLDVDLAAKVGWRAYRSPDIFPDDIFGAKVRQSTDQVSETTFGGVISVTRRF
jgi:hypothetical protein